MTPHIGLNETDQSRMRLICQNGSVHVRYIPFNIHLNRVYIFGAVKCCQPYDTHKCEEVSLHLLVYSLKSGIFDHKRHISFQNLEKSFKVTDLRL